MSTDADDRPELAARLEALERRVSALEGGPAATTPSPDAGDFWALQGLQGRMPPEGAVLFTGDVTLPTGGHWTWQEGVAVDSVLGSEWSAASAALTALHHPVRLALLRAVLNGTDTVAGLVTLDGFGTTGQAYHHVRALVAAGWLSTSRRGHYAVPGHRVVPLLVIVAAAQDH